jgi:hypothetical protein
MSDGPSLGDILGAALAGQLLPVDTGDGMGEAFDRYLAATDEQALAERAQYLAAVELSRELSAMLRVPEADVFEALTYVPDEMLPLLQSPEGWSALAALVAPEFGVLTVTYSPTRH